MHMSVAQIRQEFAEALNQAAYGKKRVVITRRGKQLAAVVPIEDFRVLEERDERLALEQAKAAWEEAKEKDTISVEEAKRILGL